MLQEYYSCFKKTVGVQANLPTNVFGFQWLIKPLLDDIDIYNMGVTISVFIEKYLFYFCFVFLCVFFLFCFSRGDLFFIWKQMCKIYLFCLAQPSRDWIFILESSSKWLGYPSFEKNLRKKLILKSNKNKLSKLRLMAPV